MSSENAPNRACEIENYDIATRIWDLDNTLGVRTTESGAGREKAESVIRAASQIYFSVESVDFMSLEILLRMVDYRKAKDVERFLTFRFKNNTSCFKYNNNLCIMIKKYS